MTKTETNDSRKRCHQRAADVDACLESGISVITFGCRLNTIESEVIQKNALAVGMQNAVIINTCAVTEEAIRDARQAIRRARRNSSTSRIIVTGCAAQITPMQFANMTETNLVLGNDIKINPATWAEISKYYDNYDEKNRNGCNKIALNEKIKINTLAQNNLVPHYFIEGLSHRTRAFVPIQNGCDHRCTFCIVPHGRGPSYSVPIEHVVQQVARLVKNGFREVVLSGVDITAWGRDLPEEPKLHQLLISILERVDALQRLRISSIDFAELDDKMIELIGQEPKIMPYLHLSLQSGDNMILKRMKRRHSRDKAIAFCQRLRSSRSDIIFGADLIAGFPTETEQMFENTVKLVQECKLSFLHVFPFSPRHGTPAARMPQLDRAVVKARAADLREIGQRATIDTLQQEIGKSRKILVEKNNQGRTEHFIRAELMTTNGTPYKHKTGEIVEAKIVDHNKNTLSAIVSNGN